MSADAPQLRRTAIHRALHRPNLLMGGDRELVGSLLVVCGALTISAQNLPSTIVAAVLYGIGIAALRWMAKSDPYLRAVYLRHLGYAQFYSARTSVHSRV